MNDKEILEFEDRAYVRPTVPRDEQMEFIDNYRNVLQNNTQRINTQTHNLGTDVPSNLGGLTGAGPTFENRYVTPQANQVVADLRAKAQGEALNLALSNLKAQLNKRYKDAYRNARINEYNKNKNGNGDGDGSKLDLESKGTGDDTSVLKNPNTGEGNLVMTGDGKGKFTFNGQEYTLRDLSDREELLKTSAINTFKDYQNGDTIEKGGVTFRYIKNNQYPKGKWFTQE